MTAVSSPASKLVLAGVDDGYASTKIYLGNNKQFKIMSSVRSGLHGLTSIHGNQSSDNSVGGYETEGIKYTVGDGVDGEGTRFDDYPGSPLNRVVLHHALRVAGLSGQAVRVATGLPVEDFYSDNGINDAKVMHKRKSFAAAVKSTEGKELAEITSNIVCAEAVSAYIDHIMTDDGKVKAGANISNPVGVVDIGGRTTDCVWVCPPDRIDRQHSGTANVGVLDLLDSLELALRQKYGVGSISRRLLEVAATENKFRIFGEDHDVTETVSKIKVEIADKIFREVQRRIGSGAELDAVIFVGGGAALMPQVAEHFRNAVTPKFPEYANARGMYKYLRSTMK